MPSYRLVLTGLLCTALAGLCSCETTPKKRAYCGLAVSGQAQLLPDSPQLQSQIDRVVSAQRLQSNLPGRKPEAVLISVSENLAVVDAITLFAPNGSASFDTTPIRRVFSGGMPVRVNLGKRRVEPR
jgi:hypothetical protein